MKRGMNLTPAFPWAAAAPKHHPTHGRTRPTWSLAFACLPRLETISRPLRTQSKSQCGIIILSQTPYDRLWRSYGFLGWFGDRRFARHALKGIRFAIYKFGPRAERNPTHIGAMEVGAKGELFLRDP